MKISRFLFSLVALFSFLTGSAEVKKPKAATKTSNQKPADWQLQVQQIDLEIQKKTNQRNLYLAKAARAQDQGDRLQFQPDNLNDAKRYWQLAEIYREKAKLLDLEVQLLSNKKQKILQQHNAIGKK